MEGFFENIIESKENVNMSAIEAFGLMASQGSFIYYTYQGSLTYPRIFFMK